MILLLPHPTGATAAITPPFPANPVNVAAPNNPARAANYQTIALAMIAKNASVWGASLPDAGKLLEALSPAIRGHGFLDLRGTSGGLADRLKRYLEYAADHHNVFPYWTLSVADKVRIRNGQGVTAQPGPHNPFPRQQPRGAVPFVIMLDGTCRIGPSLRIGMPVTTNHCYISQGVLQVAFAGEMRFGGVLADNEGGASGPSGVLVSWSNDSGGYRCSGNDASRVGLPMNLYRGTPTAAPRDRVDTLVHGVGGYINWGRSGPPRTVQTQTQDYWTR